MYMGQRPRTSFDVHRAISGREGQYSFKQSSILLSEEVLKQYKITIKDMREAAEQVDSLRLFCGMSPECTGKAAGR